MASSTSNIAHAFQSTVPNVSPKLHRNVSAICDTVLCLNGGVCSATDANDDHFICACAPGFADTYCETGTLRIAQFQEICVKFFVISYTYQR